MIIGEKARRYFVRGEDWTRGYRSMSTGNGGRRDRRRLLHQLERLLKWAKLYSLAIALAVLGFMVGIVGGFVGFHFNGRSSPNFGVDVGKALLAVGSGLILSGALKMLLDRYQAAQKKRDDEHELRERLLGNLRDVYERSETARLMINAHRSGEAYFAHMQELIGCQAVLLKFKRTLDLRRDSTEGVDDPEPVCLRDIIGYLRALQKEYACNYKFIADCERYDEAITRRCLRKLVAPGASFDLNSMDVSHQTWELLCNHERFAVLDDFTKCREVYTNKFAQPLHTLAAQLLKPTDRLRPLDTEFDAHVEQTAQDIAKDVRAIPKGSLEPVERRLNEEAPAAGTGRHAATSVISLRV